MSHAKEVVLQVHGELTLDHPAMPPCVDVFDEDESLWGIAHWYGFDEKGCARMSYDVGFIPGRGNVAHELFHAMHRLAGGNPHVYTPDDPVLSGYWKAMGYRDSLEDALALSDHIARTAGFAEAWRYYPGEQMADAFGWLKYPGEGWGGADPGLYGGSYAPENLARIDAFFRSLKPVLALPKEEVPDELTKEQYEELFLEMTRKHITPTVVAIKDAFNDHKHEVAEIQRAGITGTPIVDLGNESA